MASIANSQLPFADNAVNGNVVDYIAWNQMVQTFQAAINDNFYRTVSAFNLLNADGSLNENVPLSATPGVQNVIQMQMGPGITITGSITNGAITFHLSISDGAVSESMLAPNILQDVFYTQTQLNNGQLDSRYYTSALLNNGQLDDRYYTQSQVDGKLNSVAFTATIQAGITFPATPTVGQVFYRTDLHQLYVYDAAQAQWNVTGKTYSAGTGIGIDANNDITNTGVTSFNGAVGAVSYNPPVTSVNGMTGAVVVPPSTDPLLIWMNL